jgi:adenylate cyclase
LESGSIEALGAPRLAVMPFVNFSPDSNDSYFADGLTEELITLLSQLKEIRVIARTSAFAYKSTTKSVSQIGRELEVATIVEGSVRKSQDLVRITVQLIDVATQEHLWSNTYNRKLTDIFAVQTEVAKRIAKALKVELRGPEASHWETRSVPQSDSYLAYLKGRAALTSEWSERALTTARSEFERAVSLDPTNARALAGLADALRLLAWGGYSGPQEVEFAKAREYIDRALKLDPNLAEAHSALGLDLWDKWDYRGAERELRRAIELNPSLASAHQELASIYRDEGRMDDALRESAIAEAVDPNSGLIVESRIIALVEAGRLDEARRLIERYGKIAPGSQVYYVSSAWLALGEGNFQGIVDNIDRGSEVVHEDWGDEFKAWAYALMGNKDAARASLTSAEHRTAHPINREAQAVAYALLGDFDRAFEIYFQAVKDHDLSFQTTRNLAQLETFRKDPRFNQLLRALNLG